MHEYKRQQMNALYIIHKYLEIKAGKSKGDLLGNIAGRNHLLRIRHVVILNHQHRHVRAHIRIVVDAAGL